LRSEVSTARLDRWHRKALRAFHSGELDTAEAACKRLIELAPRHADAWFLAAVCALRRGHPSMALERFDKATAFEAGRADYWGHRAHCLALLGRHAEARISVDRAAALPIADAATRDMLGNVLVRLGLHAEAVVEFDTAARQSPRQPRYQYNLATALMHCGDLAAAETAYERALEIDPDLAWAHLALAHMLESAPPAGRVGQLEAALERARGDVDRELVIRQALARTLEASGDTTAAFAHWAEGKSARKDRIGYTIEEDRFLFSTIERLFEASTEADPRPGAASTAPVFVIGMPRSGTTLVERILSSHSAVTPGGEMTYFADAVKEAGGSRNGHLIDVDALGPALAGDPAAIGTRYLERVRATIGDSEYFVDKQPLNFFFVGFICRSLPNAKIVCLRRNPLDTCLSNFRHLFALGSRYYRYTLSLADMAEYVALFEKLMAHWDRLFPGAVYHLQYEALVADPDAEIRRLLAFIELRFEPRILSFHRNEAPVSTASLVQVRRPIYQDSVGAWRRYARELEPLRRRLEELGVKASEQ
jgi:tetratricopeptide (TPR) repeat protein